MSGAHQTLTGPKLPGRVKAAKLGQHQTSERPHHLKAEVCFPQSAQSGGLGVGVGPRQRSAPSRKALLLLCLPLAPGCAQAKGTLTPALPRGAHAAHAWTIRQGIPADATAAGSGDPAKDRLLSGRIRTVTPCLAAAGFKSLAVSCKAA